jgi:hypothetical protein
VENLVDNPSPFVNYPQILVDCLLITPLVSDKITVDIFVYSPACENLRGFVPAGLSGCAEKLSTSVDKHVDNLLVRFLLKGYQDG